MKTILAIFAAVLVASLSEAAQGPKSISIVEVRTNEALRVKSEYKGKGLSIGQVVSALPEHLNAAFTSAGKFSVIESRDIGRTIDDNNTKRATGEFDTKTLPKRGKLKAAQYEITVDISHFLDNEHEDTFAGGSRGYKREISLAGTIKIVNSETAEMEYSGSVKSEVKDATVLPAGEKLNTQQFEKLIPELLDEFSTKTVQFTVEKLYPLKVINREGDDVDINTDISSGLKVGEMLLVYSPEKLITDEDSGKTRRISGALIGKVSITLVDANECKGKIAEEKEKGKIVPKSVLKRQDTGNTETNK